MPRESSIRKRVEAQVEALNGGCYKTDRDGEPDLICCIAGRMIVIETKQPNEIPTRLQMHTLRVWARRGAVALFTDNATQYWRTTTEGNINGIVRDVAGNSNPALAPSSRSPRSRPS